MLPRPLPLCSTAPSFLAKENKGEPEHNSGGVNRVTARVAEEHLSQ